MTKYLATLKWWAGRSLTLPHGEMNIAYHQWEKADHKAVCTECVYGFVTKKCCVHFFNWKICMKILTMPSLGLVYLCCSGFCFFISNILPCYIIPKSDGRSLYFFKDWGNQCSERVIFLKYYWRDILLCFLPFPLLFAMLGIEPRFSSCKASTVPTEPHLWPICSSLSQVHIDSLFGGCGGGTSQVVQKVPWVSPDKTWQ